MAETVFKSAGVSTKEIDLSGPSSISPTGTPAGVIGTSIKGRAFVPITVANYQNFVSEFGNSDGKKFGPIAMNEWLRNAASGLYVRLLGVGDGKKRNVASNITNAWGDSLPSDGAVKNAGFVVGQELPAANGNLGANAYAGSAGPGSRTLGRAYMLGCFMSESAGSNIFSDAGLLRSVDNEDVRSVSGSYAILRGMVMAPSGVILSLSSTYAGFNTAVTKSQGKFYGGEATGADCGDTADITAADGGSFLGTVNIATNARKDIVMLLNGHTSTTAYPNIITASLDPKAPNYFASAFNRDPQKLQQAGHLLYSHYDIDVAYAVVTGSGLVTGSAKTGLVGNVASATNKKYEACAFLLTSSLGRNAGSTTVPNFENYNDRFTTAHSPFVVSQQFGGKNKNLFRLHAMDDGVVRGPDGKKIGEAGSCAQYKISILNIQKSSSPLNKFGEFDLVIRKFDDTDLDPHIYETFRNLNLDPASENYIARRLGDQRLYFDFDKNDGAQKIVLEGSYPNISAYVRVEVDNNVKNGVVDTTALPVGFRGPWHLVTSASSIVDGYGSSPSGVTNDMLRNITQPPVPYLSGVFDGAGIKKTSNSDYYWGLQTTLSDNITEPNKSTKFNGSVVSWTKYFPNYHTTNRNLLVGNNEGVADSGGTVLDADRFCNNLFTLERVQVVTGANDLPRSDLWASASYRRDGTLLSGLSNSRFLAVTTDFGNANVQPYLKFTFPIQAGFDGVCAFDKDKAALNDNAAKREMDDATEQGGTQGPTVAAYRKAVDVMSEKADVDIKLLAIPGARDEGITDYALDAVETRFDALYIMDIEERDQINSVVTSSKDSSNPPNISVTNTITSLQNRTLDSSFAAAYFPDVSIRDPRDTSKIVIVPPSVGVLGAFSQNDAVAHPWFAPAGFTRGIMPTVTETNVKLSRANMDALYSADVNPLAAFTDTPGVVVWGQKTLLATQSALDRVNVRRLLIEVRRQVKAVGNSLLFEPNRESTLARFSSAVNPILGRIQQQQGLDRFKVIIDTTTTTQADVENNTIRGKIFLQPTRSLEFISLDFVVTNAGTEI